MEDFKLYNKILDYNSYVRKYVVINIPSVHRDIRIRFLDETYNLVRLLYQAIYTKGNIRQKNIVEMQVTISLLDYLTSEIYNLNCVKRHSLDVSIDKLSEIKNIIFAWKKKEEGRKCESNL